MTSIVTFRKYFGLGEYAVSIIIERTREENQDPVRSETMSRYGPKPRRGCGPYLLIVELRTRIEILRHAAKVQWSQNMKFKGKKGGN